MFKTIKRIIQWCGSFKKRLYTGFVFSFFSYWFTAAPVALAALSIEKLITNKESITSRYILVTTLLILLFVFLRFLFDYLRARFQETISFELVARDRLAIGDALKRVSLGYFQNISTGNILSSITTGLTTLEEMGIRMLDTFIGGYLNFVAILLFLLFVSPLCAIVAISATLISLLGLLLISRCSNKNAPRESKNNSELTSHTIEYARGLPIVKSFGQSGAASKAINSAIEESRKVHIKGENSFLLGNTIHLLSLKCGTIAMLLAVCFALLNGSLSLSLSLMLMFFSFTIFISLEPLSDSAHVLGVINNAMNNVDALKEESYIDKNGKDIKLTNYDISFNNVTFGYDKRTILNDVSFDIKENTSTAIVGPSGSGKTTIVNLLARFYDVDNGSIKVGGHDVKEFTCDSLLSNISMVFQNVYLFNDTVRNNICFGKPNATESEMIEASKKACCHDFIMKLPNGYDTVIGEGGGTLSGGEKQRISIARAMLKDAPIIILDEATASIDPENEHLIQKAISSLTKGKTIITIAHRLRTIQNADTILVVDDGKIIQKGNHDSLIKVDGLYKRFIEARSKAEGWSIE